MRKRFGVRNQCSPGAVRFLFYENDHSRSSSFVPHQNKTDRPLFDSLTVKLGFRASITLHNTSYYGNFGESQHRVTKDKVCVTVRIEVNPPPPPPLQKFSNAISTRSFDTLTDPFLNVKLRHLQAWLLKSFFLYFSIHKLHLEFWVISDCCLTREFFFPRPGIRFKTSVTGRICAFRVLVSHFLLIERQKFRDSGRQRKYKKR